MIGKSKQMQKIYRLLEKISSSESSVFILGENGTGKGSLQKQFIIIHRAGIRFF